MNDIKQLIYNLDQIKDAKETIIKLDNECEQYKHDLSIYQLALYEVLKTCIGKTIYWAKPNWNYENHKITDVCIGIYEHDFFDTKDIKYKGTKRVFIEVDNRGTYLADHIGTSLFFDLDEAINHSAQANTLGE